MLAGPRSVTCYLVRSYTAEFYSGDQWIFLLIDHSFYCAFRAQWLMPKRGAYSHIVMETDDHDDKGSGGYGWKARASFAEHITGRNTAPHTWQITSSLLVVIIPVNFNKFYSTYMQCLDIYYSHIHLQGWSEDGDSMFLRNVGIYRQVHMMLQPRRTSTILSFTVVFLSLWQRLQNSIFK
jgi:hypothetical protein